MSDGAGTGYDSAKLEEIMVKFRPIAPKPPVLGSENQIVFTKTRAKRRYVRVNGRKSQNKKVAAEERSSESDPSSGDSNMVTLSLLPETPGSVRKISSDPPIQESSPQTAAIQLQRQMVSSVGSLVIVECVDASVNENIAMMVDLETDTCPGFISDGGNRVWWTNQAYKMMVGSEIVWIVMKDRFPLTVASVFVCRVRFQYTSGNGKKTMIVPCDVWRIDGGGFAWRLDVQAALSLGR